MTPARNNDLQGRRTRILVAPLDWGLGHATRCIPIIRILLQHGNEVVIAASGMTADLLAREFPGIKILSLPGYEIRYSRSRYFFSPKLIFQIPKMLRVISREKAMIKKWLTEEKIDAVISDNRPFIRHDSVPSVYITHQLHVETGHKWMNRLAGNIHRRIINAFSECWVPDEEEGEGWAGKLSHPDRLPGIPVRYIGLLSRFRKMDLPIRYDLLIMLSGPEPQRSQLEKKLLRQAGTMRLRIALLRGLPGRESLPAHPDHIRLFNHLPSEELNDIICSSACVAARGGYSTIMDLAVLSKPALLIPTPGQSEQEYITTHLGKKGKYHSVDQNDISLDADLKKIISVIHDIPSARSNAEVVIKEWLKRNEFNHV